MKERIVLYQQRDFGSKINATFNFIKQEFKPLLTCLAYLVLPITLLCGVAYGLYNANIYAAIGEGITSDGYQSARQPLDIFTAYFSGMGLLMMLAAIVSYLFLFSVVLSYMKIYQTGKQDIRPSDVWNESAKHLPSLAVLMIVDYILIIISTLLFLIPGIYVSIVLSLSVCILIFENLSLKQVLSESFSIIQGKWWSTFGLIIILSFIAGVLSLFFSLPNTLYSTSLLVSPENANPIISALLGILYFVGLYVVYVVLVIGIAFQYFNLHERKYETGLMHDINAIGQNTED